MNDKTTLQPLKDLAYACQSFLFWHDEFQSENEWTALKNESDYIDRLRTLVPICIDLIKADSK